MLEKSRVVKRIKVPTTVIKKAKSAERLNVFWQFVIESLRGKRFKIDVSRVHVGKDLSKILSSNCSPYDWLDVGPVEDDKITTNKEFYTVEFYSGWNLATRRRTACERVRKMLG